MHYVYNAYHESSPFFNLLIIYKFEIVDKGYGTILMKGKHFNNITSFVLYKNIVIYPHNKIFIVFMINYLLPILLTTY
jgi:hypothetical protein